jgi:NitT/TauT family transport system ATP-binding protein
MTATEATRGAGVSLRDLVVRYPSRRGPVHACGPIDLDVPAGRFVALLGPTGCGKSTVLNAVAGFVRPDRGEVRVGPHAVTAPGRDRGVVFQQYALFPWLTALGNVELALEGTGLTRGERRERALETLAQVKLADALGRYPRELSGGMQQRVAIARMLAVEPAVMLMDEPFGSLDAQTRLVMQELLLGIWERERRTVLFVTHDIDEALLLADEVHVMSRAPGVICDTVEVDRPRPRHADDQFLEQYLIAKRRIGASLRPVDEASTAGEVTR